MTLFRSVPDAVWAGLATEAEALVSLLACREPEVYRRYWHWWAKLPAGEVRTLPG